MGLKPRATPSSDGFEIGQVYAVGLDDGRFTACQIIDVDDEKIELLSLHLLLERRPSLEDAGRARPLELTHHSWRGGIERTWVSREPLPTNFELVGQCALVYEPTEKGRSYGGPGSVALQIRSQVEWDALPVEVQRGYKDARSRRAETIEIDLGAEKRTVGAGATSIDVEGAVNWSSLDALGALTELGYRGGDTAVVDYVIGRPLIKDLSWEPDGLSEVDLRKTDLREVGLVCDGVRRLRLPPSCNTLRLRGAMSGMVVDHPRGGANLELHFFKTAPALAELAGLEALKRFTLGRVETFDAASLRRFTRLHVLALSDIGRIDNIEALAELPELALIDLSSCYDFDAGAFPTHVRRVAIDGLRKSDATTLKARLAHIAGLTIRGAKNETWLKTNLHNPFRDWVDFDARKGKAACKAYTAAVKAVDKGAALEPVLRAFVDALNALDAKHGLDTVDREDAYGAFGDLVAHANAESDSDRWDAAFDDWRDF